jgi:photosystem II stability/assembly factor-like uncharacterized protein
MKRCLWTATRSSGAPRCRVLPAAVALSAAMFVPAESMAASVWRSAGPDGGPVEHVAASATTLYAATQSGVYRSFDEGRQWTWSSAGMPRAYHVRRVDISPTDPNVLWAYGDSAHWRSGDGGTSWTRMDPGWPPDFKPVVFDDASNGDSLVTFRSGERLLRHSTDGGFSWRRLGFGTSGQGRVDTFAVDARHRTYYAIVDGRLLTSPSGVGVWRVLSHHPYGQDWLLPDGSNDGLILGFQNIESYRVMRYEIPTGTYQQVLDLPNGGWPIADPATPGRLWLQTWGYDGAITYQLRESRDFGRSWDAPHSTGALRTLAADSHLPGRLYGASLRGFALSDDAGRHWETRTRGVPQAIVNAVALDPRDPTRFLAGTELGEVLLGTGDGTQWSSPATGLSGAPVLALAYAPSMAMVAFAATREGLYRSDDGGLHWNRISSTGLPSDDGSIDRLIVDAGDISLLTARTRGGGLYWSDDAGLTWRLGESNVLQIEASPNGRRLYALQQPWPNTNRWLHLLRADRHGAPFERVDERTLTMALAVNPHADNVILALSNETGASLSYATRMSSDGGHTWHERDRLFLSWTSDVRLRFDPCDSRTVYATTSGSSFARSRDLGLTWEYEELPLRGDRVSELSTRCHRGRNHLTVHGGPRGVLVREPETVDAIWRWGYDGD